MRFCLAVWNAVVGVAQLAELRIVIPAVVGSIPIAHPDFAENNLPGLAGCCAGVVELADTLDLGSSAERRESSSLSFRTIYGWQWGRSLPRPRFCM